MTLAPPSGARIALLGCFVAVASIFGCDRRVTTLADATSEGDVAVDLAKPSDDTLDASFDADFDASTDAAFDAASDAQGDRADAARDALDASADRTDAALDVSNPFLDVRVEETGPDPYGDCGVASSDLADAPPPCTPGAMISCVCSAGPTASRVCLEDNTWSACRCPEPPLFTDLDAGPIVPRVPPGVFEPIPVIPGPRLLAPQSGSQVTTLRPTFRWRLPDGATRARVELCVDRPCARMIARQEIAGSSWRPTDALAHGVVFWRVRALDAVGAVTWASATWEFGVPRRDTPVDTSYGVLKDFNGDGFDDVVAQSSMRRPRGGIRVFTGGPDGISGARARVLNPPEQPSWDTDRNSIGAFGDQFAVGDLNGDGLADIIASDYLYDELPMSFPADGRAYIFWGSRSCVLTLSERSYRPLERARPFECGRDVGAGDFNGDGYADMLVTSNGSFGEELKLYLGSDVGPVDPPVSTSSVGGRTGQFVGDVNGDGYADVFVRSRNYQEPGLNDFALVVLYGNPEGRLTFHVQYIEMPFRAPIFNWIIRWGDVNEDNYADAVVSFNGWLYVFYGSADGIRRSRRLDTPPGTGGGSGSASFGIGLSMPADVNGDGHAELLAGAEAADEWDGRVYVFSTTAGDLPTGWTSVIRGPSGLVQEFSRSAIPGDLDGDGINDVVIGAPHVFVGSSQIGILYVYRGGAGEWWARPQKVLVGPDSGSIL